MKMRGAITRMSLGALLLLSSGCGLIPARIKSAGVTVTAVKDAGKPATLDTGETKTTFAIPAETRMVTTKTEATATAPAKTVVEWDFTKPTQFEEVASTIKADTGTVDTTLAVHKVDVASRQPLLYAAIGALVLCAAMVYLEHPTAALLCGAGAGILFAAWRMPDLPEWFWMVAVGAVIAGLALVFGHAKGVANSTATPVAK